MKIGIFSKFNMNGGSEFRCAALCSAIDQYTEHEAYLICEGGIPDKIEQACSKGVNIHKNTLTGNKPEIFYEMDRILVVNTDSKNFTTLDYWEGKSDIHKTKVDLTKIKMMAFLFNFIITPSHKLVELMPFIKDIRLIPTNERFYNELTTRDKLKDVKHLPRITLPSPIDKNSVSTFKTPRPGGKIRIGKHSKGMSGKWNDDHVKVIEAVNKKIGHKVIWDFMGAPRDLVNKLKDIPNVITRPEFQIPVNRYLEGIDIFFFFLSWRRNEPFARASAEGMMSGCPLIATADGAGNEEQVLHGNNGYLFKKTEEAIEHLIYLVENPNLIDQMGKNSEIYSRDFESRVIIDKLIRFLE